MNDKVKEAMETIKQAMIDDSPEEPGSYAHGWHCNIAMMCHDAMFDANTACGYKQRHEVANDAASRFMKLCFDVDTSA